jgi:hypothetical protein
MVAPCKSEFVLCGPFRHPLLIIQESIKKGVWDPLQNHSVSSTRFFLEPILYLVSRIQSPLSL